jgi:hypothetical protein
LTPIADGPAVTYPGARVAFLAGASGLWPVRDSQTVNCALTSHRMTIPHMDDDELLRAALAIVAAVVLLAIAAVVAFVLS